MRTILNFLRAETGAITVDWVVLTAAVIGVLFGALTTFNQGVTDHATLTSDTMGSQGIASY